MRSLPESVVTKKSFAGSPTSAEEVQPPQVCGQDYRPEERRSYRINRVRALLTLISLAFLTLFLFIVYQKFGLVVLAVSLAVILLMTLAFVMYLRSVLNDLNDSEVQIS